MRIKVSVIISVYNCEEYVEDCLNSLERQTMSDKEYEAIIINDGSKDNSLKIIKKYCSKHKFWKLIDRDNRGLAQSRNEGLDIAKGEYVTFFDADDILEDNALESMYEETNNNNSDIGIFRTINFNKSITYPDVYSKLYDKIDSPTNIRKNPLVAKLIRSVAILYKNQLIKKIRFIKGHIHEDNYFCIKTYSLAESMYISKTVVYRIRKRDGENLSITQNLNFKTFNDLIINIKTADLEVKNGNIIKLHINQLFGYIRAHVENEHKSKAKIEVNKYIKLMYKENIISFAKYLYLKSYFSAKYLLLK